MSVVSLNGAVGFYENCGYQTADNRCLEKKITQNMVGVVPVFKPTLGGLRAKVCVDYDKKFIKQCVNQPMFVYVTYDGEIDAVAIRTPDKEIKIWTNEKKCGMADFYRKQLLRAFEKVK